MLESIKGLNNDAIRTIEQSIDFEDENLWNKMNWMVTLSLQQQLDLEANR
jgi:hypothetical protein